MQEVEQLAKKLADLEQAREVAERSSTAHLKDLEHSEAQLAQLQARMDKQQQDSQEEMQKTSARAAAAVENADAAVASMQVRFSHRS